MRIKKSSRYNLLITIKKNKEKIILDLHSIFLAYFVLIVLV